MLRELYFCELVKIYSELPHLIMMLGSNYIILFCKCPNDSNFDVVDCVVTFFSPSFPAVVCAIFGLIH